MARVRIIVEDDNGQPLTAEAEHIYALAGSCDTLDAIDEAVEQWRKQALPAIEQTLLTKAQEQAIAQKNRA